MLTLQQRTVQRSQEGGGGVLQVSSDGDDRMGEKNKFGFALLTELLGRDMSALPPVFRLF